MPQFTGQVSVVNAYMRGVGREQNIVLMFFAHDSNLSRPVFKLDESLIHGFPNPALKWILCFGRVCRRTFCLIQKKVPNPEEDPSCVFVVVVAFQVGLSAF
jgi:hypothetical protein